MTNSDDNPLFQNLPGSKPKPDKPDKTSKDDDDEEAAPAISLGSPHGGASHWAKNKKVIQPLPGQTGRDEITARAAEPATASKAPEPDNNKSAIDMLRYKIDSLYASEPSAKEEIKEIEHTPGSKLSKHQRFLQNLSDSGKPSAEIQAEWHKYYAGLPDNEKHEVWQEFYNQNNQKPSQPQHKPAQHHHIPKVHGPQQSAHSPAQSASRRISAGKPKQDLRSVKEVKDQLLSNVSHRAKAKKKPSHLRSITFGLASGSIVVMIMLFGFFNERIIAPFITPSRSVSSTPIIVDPNSTKVGPEPMIIIPKINVEIPVVYNEPSIQEEAIQSALEKGVVHYATTTKPGEIGNGVIFGHSSNNILNRGNYKFAFVLLSRLEKGDTFMLHKDGKRYVYKIYEKKIVPPTDLSVLGKTSRPATFSLITCDPPGTSINRLVVIGEQIAPDPKANIASTAKKEPTRSAQLEKLPSDAPTLWDRLFGWISG